MALVRREIITTGARLAHINFRRFSTPVDANIKKCVFISQSNDIFTNLALEDWLYKNFDFSRRHLLMLWCNEPCVVIGRFQNPWLEANVSDLPSITDNGVKLARRFSGGGTVYQDQGNLNMTFFTPQDRYNRKYNLEIVVRALFREYGLKADISPREDLTVRGLKVSGTASKLGRPNSYHHCTLLVEVNKVDLHYILQKRENGIIKSNATKSLKSRILNLCEENPKITVEKLLTVIGWEYLRTEPLSAKDGGKDFANQQNGFHMVNPTEQWFPGITAIRDSLSSWDWCYGKTPKFIISRAFSVPVTLLNTPDGCRQDLQIKMEVENGKISEVTLFVPPGLSKSGFSGEVKVLRSFKDQKFTEEALNSPEWFLNNYETEMMVDGDKFVTDCVRQVMTSV